MIEMEGNLHNLLDEVRRGFLPRIQMKNLMVSIKRCSSRGHLSRDTAEESIYKGIQMKRISTKVYS